MEVGADLKSILNGQELVYRLSAIVAESQSYLTLTKFTVDVPLLLQASSAQQQDTYQITQWSKRQEGDDSCPGAS